MLLRLSVLFQFTMVFVSPNVYHVTVCEDQLLTIGCSEESKIFIKSAFYGRSDQDTCLLPNRHAQTCNSFIDLSWQVMPFCQGKSSCVLNGSYHGGNGRLCDSNSTSYLNVSYSCEIIKETVLAENTTGNFTCPTGEVFVVHWLEWRGIEYFVPTQDASESLEIPDAKSKITDAVKNTTSLSDVSNTRDVTSTLPPKVTMTVLTASSSVSSSPFILASSPTMAPSSLKLSASPISFSRSSSSSSISLLSSSSSLSLALSSLSVTSLSASLLASLSLPAAKIASSKLLRCFGKRKCLFTVTRNHFGNKYKGRITRLWLAVRHSCQPAESGYLQWSSWNSCSSVCGVQFHQVRRRKCINPRTKIGGADCSGPSSQSNSEPCHQQCVDHDSTTCYLGNANVSCPSNTFININSIFYGDDQGACSSSDLAEGSCSPSADVATYNSAKVYERCQMRRNCSILVSNDTFLDPCVGYSKHLKIQYSCNSVLKRTFCDNDNVLVSCPKKKRIVFHNQAFYGRQNGTDACETSNANRCTSHMAYDDLKQFCTSSSCGVAHLSVDTLALKSCYESNNYLTLQHSCQEKNAIYTAWGLWESCWSCGLTARQDRRRQCIDPGIDYNALRGCSDSQKQQERSCYTPCEEHNVTLIDGENSTIVCPFYGGYTTLIDVRSVFYGSDSCRSANGSKPVVMKRCQGRNRCYLEASPTIFHDSCPGIAKYLNVSYKCQPIYKISESENYNMVPRNLLCYENMVIVTHSVMWWNDDCPSQHDSFEAIHRLCDGRHFCSVNHTRSALGDPCPAEMPWERLYFEMQYSCQSAFGGLDTQWSAWSNCTECGHLSVKTRVKPCVSPVTESSGGHCPSTRQVSPCDNPCPVDGLSLINNPMAVGVGQPLSIEWMLALGTNVTAIISWGDNLTNETVSNIFANASSPFTMDNEHNYSTEGDYVISIHASNWFSNRTISSTVYAQVMLAGLTVALPSVLSTNSSIFCNASLNSTSLNAPNISFDFGDGSVFTSTSLATNYSYSHSGVYTVMVKAENLVSKINTNPRRITVQDTIKDFKVDKNVYLVALGTTLRMGLFLSQGTNVSVNATCHSCGIPSLFTILNGTSFFGVALTHTIHTVSVCDVFIEAWNLVSGVNTSAVVISEASIEGFDVRVQCQSKFPSCFQYDSVLINVHFTNGTRPKFVFDMGDGHSFCSTNSSFLYAYDTNGSFHINVTAYNNVSRISSLVELDIFEVIEIKEVDLVCNRSVEIADQTTCNLAVVQGTAFECVLNLGDTEQDEFYAYYNLTSIISYNYTSYGTYMVQFTCSNSVSLKSVTFQTNVVPKTLKMAISSNSPVILSDRVTFILQAYDTGHNSCFALDLGNGAQVIFGSASCTTELPGTSFRVSAFTYPFVEYNYTYNEPGSYNVTWTGNNAFDSLSLNTLVVITKHPCRVYQVTLQNLGKDPSMATTISRSKQFIISSKYDVNCIEASAALVTWELLKNVTEKGFMPYDTMVTKSSELIIAANKLEYGLYKIRMNLKLVLHAGYGIDGFSEGYFKVAASDLFVDLQEGSANRRMLSRSITVNASWSRDPDTVDAFLEFHWYCYNVTDRFVNFSLIRTPLSSMRDALNEKELPDGCFDKHGRLSMSGPIISLPRERVIREGVYLVELVLKAGNRESRKATVVQVRDEVVAHLHLRCKVNCKHLVVTTDIVSVSSSCISVDCAGANSAALEWELFHRRVNETGVLNWTKVIDIYPMILSSAKAGNLVLRANVLIPETVYVIRLWHGMFPHRGLAEYSFTTSVPPSGGHCSVTPLTGIAMQTLFRFSCYGWKTKHPSLRYVVDYVNPYTRLLSTLYQTEEKEFSAKLPPGDPKHDQFILVVQFSVIDSLGARNVTRQSIKVVVPNVNRSEFYRLVLKENHLVDFYLDIGDVASASELIIGVLSRINYHSIHLANDSSLEDMNLRSRIRNSVIEKVHRIPTLTLPDVNQVSTMMAAATEVKEEVNITSQLLATDKLESMIILLVNKSEGDIAFFTVTEATLNLITAVFNVLSSASYCADFRRKTDIQAQDISKEVANRNLEAIDKLSEAIFNQKVPGQEDTEIRTKSAILTCRRALKTDVFYYPIVAGNASVQFPNISHLLPEEEVDIQLLHMPFNPFTWDESSTLVSSTIVDVKIRYTQGDRQMISILNLTEDIDLQIPVSTSGSGTEPAMFYIPDDNQTIHYHSFVIEQTNQAAEVHIQPVEKRVKLTVLVQYGRKPTLTNYDYQATLPNYTNCPVDGAAQDAADCKDNPYSLFLPSTYLTIRGTYYVGVKYEKVDKNYSSDHSRGRRGCGRGGRSKRSCIKYKDPPTSLPSGGKFVLATQKSYDKTKHDNYTLEQLSLGCNFWNPSANKFSSGGCRSGRRRSFSRILTCRCKHLTSFGGGIFVTPTPIDFDQVWVAFADIHDNMAVLATMVSIFLLYLLFLVWARRADVRDLASQQGEIVIRKGCNMSGSHVYEVTISTSKARNAGTTASVSLVIVGENGSSGSISLNKLNKVKFSRGSVITFHLYLPNCLGPLVYLHIWHDNAGDSPSWNLDHVVIRNTQSDEKWNFLCLDWLAVESMDGRTDKVLYVAHDKEMANYKHLFLSNGMDGLYDGHLWISAVAKIPHSSFTRVQRSSCCLSLLFCTMITNAMFYDREIIDTSTVFILGPVKLTVRELMIGIQSSLIIFPINLALSQLFRKSSAVAEQATDKDESSTASILKRDPTHYTTQLSRKKSFPGRNYSPVYQSRSFSSLHSSTLSEGIFPSNEKLTNTGSIFNLRRTYSGKHTPKLLNHLALNRRYYVYRVLYFLAWILCFVSVFTAASFTLMYSLLWGSEKSQQWLLSFLVSFIQDAAVSQPLKVAIFSAVIAFVIKFSMDQRERFLRRSGGRKGRENPPKVTFSTEVEFADENSLADSQPLNKKALQNFKIKRMKEMKSSEVMKDVGLYSLFLLLLIMVSYGHRDPIAYEMTSHLKNTFYLSGRSQLEVWDGILYGIIPNIFASPWYNGLAPSAADKAMIPDRASAVVGMARLRQLRVQNDSCGTNIPLLRYLAQKCHGPYRMDDEDSNMYRPYWQPVPGHIPIENITYDMCPKPWRYHTAAEIEGVPIWGETTIYSGGGYVAELGYYYSKAVDVIHELASHDWIDRRTRAVFVELTVYNSQVNLFGVITLLAEFLPTGSVVTFNRIDTARVYRYLGELSGVQLAAELIIVLVILFYLYKVIKKWYHQRKRFFMKFWNLADLLQVLFALISFVLYFVKMVNINHAMRDLGRNPFVFVNFSRLLAWNEMDTYMIALVVFLTTIKFLYLLRYNTHIRLLAQTFHNMRHEMCLFLVQFTLWFLPFVVMAHIMFGAHSQDFMSLLAAFQALLNAVLGAAYFHDLQEVDRVLGPTLFLTYSVLMQIILLNLFISIINAAFGDRKCKTRTTDIEPDLAEFISDKLRAILGFKTFRRENETKWYVDDSSDEGYGYRTKKPSWKLREKLLSLEDNLAKVLSMEEEEEKEEIFLGMILWREHRAICRRTSSQISSCQSETLLLNTQLLSDSK